MGILGRHSSTNSTPSGYSLLKTIMFKLIVSLLLVTASRAFIFGASGPTTVPARDVDKYLGRWYQMYASASVVTLWEAGAVCVTADYEKATDGSGTVTVLNSERINNGSVGTLKVIHGYAKLSNEPGKLTVHLEGVPLNAAYWVLKLGPVVNDLYEYAIVSDNLRGTLFVLARDPDVFLRDYDAEVKTFLSDDGFTSFYNRPISTYHGKDCAYNGEHH